LSYTRLPERSRCPGSVSHTDSLIDFLRLPRELVLEFFVAFSRFEFALKTAGFVYDPRGAAEADWNRYIADLEKQDSEQLRHILDIGERLFQAPPKRLTLEDGNLLWKEAGSGGQSNIRILVEALKRTRNNLFHGGKFLTAPQPIDRNMFVVSEALAVLYALLDAPFAASVRNAFHELPSQPS
jgi:hypothetical protein